MHLTGLTLFVFGLVARSTATATSGSITARDDVTDIVLELTVHEDTRRISTPSSQHLARRRADSFNKRQSLPLAPTQENLIGLGGRIYIANVTIGGQRCALVIDTGSSDTWVATTTFRCLHPSTYAVLPQSTCGFGPMYNRVASSTFKPINYDFQVDYTGGEFLDGIMGNDQFGIGGVSRGQTPYITINQTIGAVEDGYWTGDKISSGLMGLAYPALANGVNIQALNYTSVMYTLFQNKSIAPVFSIALNRPTTAAPGAGGLLAIGGIPNITTDNRWVQTPITPIVQNVFAYYSINIDGFDITPPSPASTTSARTPAPSPSSTGGPYKSSKQNMIIDSGTSLLYFPDVVAAYIGSLFIPPARYSPSYNTYLVPCTARAPRVGVRIAGQSYFISEDDLMNRGPGAVGGAGAGARSGECVLAVMNAAEGSLVLGDSWLKNVLVVFDVANGTDIGVGGSDQLRNGGGSVRVVGREKY